MSEPLVPFLKREPPLAGSHDSTAGGSRSTVVVADDDADIRALLGEYLADCGFTVLQAANGLETLFHVKRARPAAVVLDVHMPRLGGVEALTRIRAFDPAIVITVVTGDEDTALHRRMVELGAAGVFLKPVKLAALAAALGLVTKPSTPAPEPLPAAAPPPPVPVSPPRPTILVVDDDANLRDLLRDYLDELGYEVCSVSDGPSALRRIAAAAPDVVLLDVELPGLNGLIALPSIRALAPSTAILVISGSIEPGLAEHALTYGACDYLGKPIDLQRLTVTLEKALARRRVQA